MIQSQYRSINLHEVLHEDTYGIEGKYLISIHAEGCTKLLSDDKKPTIAGQIAIDYWNKIPKNFNHIELHEYILTAEVFYGVISIDLSGKTVGEKQLYYNVVSQFDIAFGMMVSRKNPFGVEGSIFHVISWFKAASLIEIVKYANPSFRWKSGYFDSSIKSEKEHKYLLKKLNGPVV